MSRNYQNGKIYKFVSDTDDGIYIGSTTQPLYKRWNYHKTKALAWPERRVYKHITETGGWDNWRIVLVEDCPCDNEEQLKMKEEEHRQKYHGEERLMNTYRSVLTYEQRLSDQSVYQRERRKVIPEKFKKWQHNCYVRNKEKILARRHQYYEDNKDVINMKTKAYYETNKEGLLAHYAKKVECDVCGALLRRNGLTLHKCSIKHQEAQKIYDFIHS